MGYAAMDYTPSIEYHAGEYTDMMIEEMLNLIYQNYYDADFFNETFTNIVRTYITPDCPALMASLAGKDRISGGAVHYISMLKLDYSVIHEGSTEWPGFSFMPDAKIAVSIAYPDGKHMSAYAPGMSINQASLAALMQIAREVAIQHYNQPELDIPPKHHA
jgi:hypothetical protein